VFVLFKCWNILFFLFSWSRRISVIDWLFSSWRINFKRFFFWRLEIYMSMFCFDWRQQGYWWFLSHCLSQMILILRCFFLVKLWFFHSIKFKLIIHHVLCNFLFRLSFWIFWLWHILDFPPFQIKPKVFFFLITFLKRSSFYHCFNDRQRSWLWYFWLLTLLTSKGLLFGNNCWLTLNLLLLFFSVFSN